MFGSPVLNPTYASSARSLVDRSDDYAGSQIKVIYAVPRGAVDQQMDLTSRIPFSLGAINRWLEAQIGRKVKFDTYVGDLDIQFVQLPRTDAEYTATNEKLYQLRFDITPAIAREAPKNLLVFYQGTGPGLVCGQSTMPTFVSGQQFSAVYLEGGGRYPCWSDIATNASAPAGLDDKHAMHEVFHGLGAEHPPLPTIPPGSEEFTNQICDLMYPYGSTECRGRVVFDPYGRFYYNPQGFADGRTNTYNSPFLTPLLSN